jgi:hypothetical protein
MVSYFIMISGVSSTRFTSIPEKGCCAPESGIVFFPLGKNYAPIIFIQIGDKMAFGLYKLEFPV